MQSQHIPGLSIAVVKSGQVVKAKGYGFGNIEMGIPASPETVYRLASLTKQFTASAIMLLVQDGRIGLDDKISRYLTPSPSAWADITVRELLTHTSGLKDYINELHMGTPNKASEEALVKAVGEVNLKFKPGSSEFYSNTNYLVLGLIVKNVSGQSYDQFLTKRVFEPLGMTQTGKVDYERIVPHRAGGYVLTDSVLSNGPYLQPTIFDNADAGLVSSASDLARWDTALLAGKILTKASEDAMFTPARLPDGSSVHYGLGWETDFGGPRFVSHAGTLPGIASYMVRYLDEQLTVIVLINLSDAPASQIARHVAAIYDPKLVSNLASPEGKEEPVVTAKMRAVIEGIQNNSLDPQLFTSNMWSGMEKDEIATRVRGIFKSYGTFQTVSFLSVSQEENKRQYFYSAKFGDVDQVLDFTLDRDGKITTMGLDVE
jgi:D-alanyl-D-alanine carboxypeptidase